MGLDSLIRRHGWETGFAVLVAAAVVLGGPSVLAGAGEFAASLVPGQPAEAADQPARAGQGIARLPMFDFAAPTHYTPQLLFPVTGHALPQWLVGAQTTARMVPATNPMIAICIDDLGEDLAGTDKAMALPKAVALSFLPYADATPFMAQEAEARGHDVLAHVPMQALSSIDPGPMTLSVGAPDIAIRAQWNIGRVPGLIGINNHEGSRFTQDAASLAPVAKILAARHLFFFDSRTGPDSKVTEVAAAYGVTSGTRDIFLDDTLTEAAVREQLDDLAAVARRQGAAIAIGHPHDVTLKVLAAWLSENHGVTLVRLPEAMARKAQAVALASR
jgi:polysaccharide deacetylase 2 family uncharacterized protein YibQ